MQRSEGSKTVLYNFVCSMQADRIIWQHTGLQKPPPVCKTPACAVVQCASPTSAGEACKLQTSLILRRHFWHGPAESHLQIAISERCACIMTIPRIKVKVVEADGTCRGDKTYINPPKTARDILERLQARGFVGDLQDSTGVSLICSDPLDDSQQYTLKLAPSCDLLTARLHALFCSLRGLLLT